MSYDKPAGHFRRNQDKYLIGGGSLLGAGIGYLSSKKSAERKAKSKGLQEGSEEYKKVVRKNRLARTAIGAGIGSMAGLQGLAGKRMYDINHQSKEKKKLKAGDIVKFTKKGPQMGQHYGVFDGEGGIIEYGEGGINTTTLKEIKNSSKYNRMKIEPAKNRSSKEDLLRKTDELRNRYSDNNYNFIDNNCEHFARELSTGERFSTQGDDVLGKVAKLAVRNKKKDPYGHTVK